MEALREPREWIPIVDWAAVPPSLDPSIGVDNNNRAARKREQVCRGLHYLLMTDQ